MMREGAEDVLKFQAAVGHVLPNEVTGDESTVAVQDLYHKFVSEEYREFIEANPADAPHKLQEAMDLIWVILGYCNTRGWDTAGAWSELFRSNMSKLQVDPTTGQLARRSDGKILKPENWRKPDFTPFVGGGQ